MAVNVLSDMQVSISAAGISENRSVPTTLCKIYDSWLSWYSVLYKPFR